MTRIGKEFKDRMENDGGRARRDATRSEDRLERIVRRQRRGRSRDLLFACFIALVAITGTWTVGVEVLGGSTVIVQR